MNKRDDRVKDLLFRQFDDTGSDTFERFWAQIEYTAYWCIRMLLPSSKIKSVIPEGIEDVVIVKHNNYELHQVKTRAESQAPWTTANVLPILCDQYQRRNAFQSDCEYHFVTNHYADTITQLSRNKKSYGALYRLKHLLEIYHAGQGFNCDEKSEFEDLKEAVSERIRMIMSDRHNEDLNKSEIEVLIHKTWIDTGCPFVFSSSPFYDDLSDALTECFPGQLPLNMPQLFEMYDRVLLLICRKVKEKTVKDRTIVRDDIVNCRSEAIALDGILPNLNNLVGNTPLEKKAIYGGFSFAELPTFSRQKLSSEFKKRQMETVGLQENIETLSVDLMTKHQECLRDLSKTNSNTKIGPDILDLIRNHIRSSLLKKYNDLQEIDELFCCGLLWIETNDCNLWWHKIKDQKTT